MAEADEAHESTHQSDHLVIPAADPPKPESASAWHTFDFYKD